MDRFQKILEAENLCFLCLELANYTCDKCELPYCNQEHYNVHYDDEKDYCYPFRVLQKPEVRSIVILYSIVIRVIRSKIREGWGDLILLYPSAFSPYPGILA